MSNGELSRAGAGCRQAEPDGEATRGSSGLLGGALSLRRPQDAGEAARRWAARLRAAQQILDGKIILW